MKRFRTILCGMLVVVLSATHVVPVFAQTASGPDYGNDDISLQSLYGNWSQYVPDDGKAGACAAGAIGSIPLVGNDNIEKAFNYFIARGLTPQASAAIVANLIVESNVDPKSVQVGGDGRGIAQWGIGARWDASPPRNGQPANLKDFAAGKDVLDLGVQLDFLWHELTNFYTPTYDEIKASTDEKASAIAFMIEYEAPFDKSPTGLNAQARSKLATDVLAQYGGTVPGTTAAPAAAAACGANGDIAAKAIALAWPEPWPVRSPAEIAGGSPDAGDPPRASALTPRKAYSDAIVASNPGQRADGADCGVFVATVMRSSGADPNYPPIGTMIQMPYMMAHPDKYQPLGVLADTSKLQPGDIVIRDPAYSGNVIGHTWIWIGPTASPPTVQPPTTYSGASASLNDRSANLGDQEFVGFSAFHPIK